MLMYSPNGKAVFPLPHIASSNKSAIFLVHFPPYGTHYGGKRNRKDMGGREGSEDQGRQKMICQKARDGKKNKQLWHDRKDLQKLSKHLTHKRQIHIPGLLSHNGNSSVLHINTKVCGHVIGRISVCSKMERARRKFPVDGWELYAKMNRDCLSDRLTGYWEYSVTARTVCLCLCVSACFSAGLLSLCGSLCICVFFCFFFSLCIWFWTEAAVGSHLVQPPSHSKGYSIGQI